MDQPLLTCDWCGKEFERPNAAGAPPRFCGRGHRQRAYEARRKAKALGATPEYLAERHGRKR